MWLTKLSNRLKIRNYKLYKKRDTFFQLKESKSALKKFEIQYRIDRKNWIDPHLFLDNAKQSITNILIVRRQTKVKLILSWMVEVDLTNGEVIVKAAAFHSKTEINLKVLTLTNCFRKWNKLFWSLEQNFKDKEVIADSIQFWDWIFTR